MTNESYRQVQKILRSLEKIRIYRQNQFDDLMKSRKYVEINNELVKKVKELSKTDNNHGR